MAELRKVLSVETLARALYEDMRASYRQEHRRPPPWEQLVLKPSTIWDPPGRGNYTTYASILDQHRRHARRVIERLPEAWS